MAQLREIVIDALRPAELACFWAAALDTYRVRGYDTGEIERLAAQGLTPETDPSVALDGNGPTIFFQRTATLKTSRNRLHLDLETTARGHEVRRLEQLGARVLDQHEGFTVMRDPEGNEFCLVGPI